MANNLIITYDLGVPGRNYQAVSDAIKSLGSSVRVQGSVWYVNSRYSTTDALSVVRRALDANDTLMVVNTSANNASWHN